LICTAWRAVRPPARRSRGCWTGRTGSSRSPGANLPPRERPRPSASVGRTQYRNQNQKQPWCRPQSNREPAPPTAPIRSNARGNSQSRALAIHSPVRTALAPAVGSDFAEVLSKLPPEELERCSELLYNQRATRVPKQQRAATLGGTSLSPVRVSMDCHINVTVCTRPFRTETAAQFLGALSRVASGEPRSASPIPAGR
jgi:hypothetical protein